MKLKIMKKRLSITIEYILFLLLLPQVLLFSDEIVDTLRKSVKLETPDIYIYGERSNVREISFTNGSFYAIMDKTNKTPVYLISYTDIESYLKYYYSLKVSVCMNYSNNPTELIDILLQGDLYNLPSYFNIKWHRPEYKYGNMYISTKHLSIKSGVALNILQYSDIIFSYDYNNISQYNGIIHNSTNILFNSYYFKSSLSKLDNNYSFDFNGEYVSNRDNFNYKINYDAFWDTSNRFVCLELIANFPEIYNNILSLGFSVYPFSSLTPHIEALLSMNYNGFGYRIGYKMNKDIATSHSFYNTYPFASNLRSFIINYKNNISVNIFYNLSRLEIGMDGSYYYADSLLTVYNNITYSSFILTNVHYSNLGIYLNYTDKHYSGKLKYTFNNGISTQYDYLPDHYLLNMSMLNSICIPYGLLLNFDLYLGFINRDISNNLNPNSFDINISFEKAIRNLHIKIYLDNIINRSIQYTDIIPVEGRNLGLLFTFKI